MNLKKIARIKKKYNLITKIRRKRSSTLFRREQHEHEVVPNVLDRNFKGLRQDEVYSTDITQFTMARGEKIYLAAVKDIGTKEIKSFALTKYPNVKFMETTVEKAIRKVPQSQRKHLIVHSDQGFQFTHVNFRKCLKDLGAQQSMSRRGNCLDNAPIESFFGHLKDHIDLKEIKSFEDLEKSVTQEIDYYNNQRPQWDLNKMPPALYRRHLVENRSF